MRQDPPRRIRRWFPELLHTTLPSDSPASARRIRIKAQGARRYGHVPSQRCSFVYRGNYLTRKGAKEILNSKEFHNCAPSVQRRGAGSLLHLVSRWLSPANNQVEQIYQSHRAIEHNAWRVRAPLDRNIRLPKLTTLQERRAPRPHFPRDLHGWFGIDGLLAYDSLRRQIDLSAHDPRYKVECN